jgi:hypothetical protein
MAYNQHPLFETPPGNARLWRYMDFPKFVSLVSTSKLFFPSVDAMLSVDPYEGSFSRATVNFFADENLKEHAKLMAPELTEEDLGIFIRNLRTVPNMSKEQRQFVYVSCWHENPVESVAMWKLYGLVGQGIAVQTTCDRLKRSVEDVSDSIEIGRVKYINYDLDVIDTNNILSPYLNKRQSFDHEHEVRALIWDYNGGKYGTKSSGLNIAVTMQQLIERIYISPDAPEWHKLVIDELLKKLHLKFEVVHSKLNQIEY